MLGLQIPEFSATKIFWESQQWQEDARLGGQVALWSNTLSFAVGGKKKPLKQPKKQSKELDEVGKSEREGKEEAGASGEIAWFKKMVNT